MAPGSPYTDAEVRAQIDPTPIGGGSGYLGTLDSGEIWTESDADVTVSTASELDSACSYSPSSGETYVVWVADGATIDMTGEDSLLTGGSGTKVIAGNRGQGGSNGPLIFSNSNGENSTAYRGGSVTGVFQVEGDVELFGVRWRGWSHDYWDSDEYPGYIPLKDSSEYYAELARCFSIRSDDVEIHNCEIYGWATQGIYVGTRGTPNDPWIHHNDIHDCMQTAFGYGVDCGNGRPLIEYNYINACRHGVNGSGYSTAGWRCYNNVFGPSYSQHPIDMHSLSNNSTGSSSNYNNRGYHGNAGGRMVFQNNTVTCTRHISDANVQGGHRTPAIGIRGVPWPRTGDGIIIEDNRFEHDEVKGPRPSPGHQYSGKENYSLATHQQWTRHDFNFSSRLGVDDYTPNFIFNGNQTNGSTAPYDPSVGAPVNLNGDTQVNRDLTIAVRSEDNNDQIEGADVTLTDDANDTWIRTTGSDGNAQFVDLPTGDYDIDIVVSGWSNFSGSFNHNSDTTRTFRLERDRETAEIRFGAFAAQAIRPWTSETNANPYPIKYEYVGPHTTDTTWTGYDARPTRSDATVTTSSLSAFYSALDSAASGDIVWLDAGDYDLTGVTTRQDIPAGVTAASDGARLFAPGGHNGTFELTNDGARLTGFRLEGEQETGSHTAQGIAILPRADVTIDNCEIYNWKTAGIYVGFSSTNATIVQPTIRHCIIRDNRTDGNGYGVATYQSADPLIEYNFLANNRESLASSGQDESAYRAFDNLHSDVADAGAIFQMEMHESDARPAESGLGATVEHNELMGTVRDNGETYRAFAQRGTPINETTINNNWIHISTPPDPNNALNADSAIVQYNHTTAGDDTFSNVTFSGNHYGTSEPSGTEGIRPLTASTGGSTTPIEGVSVTVPGAIEPEGETRTTNSQGRARFDLWTDTWDVTYSHPDYHNESFGRAVDVSQGNQAFDYTLIPIGDPRAAITIRVEDDTGTRVQGATVSVSDSNLESRHTDTSGEAVFNLPSGSFDVTASAPDLATTTETISVDASTDATHTLMLAPDETGGGGGDDDDDGPTQPSGEQFYEVCALETAADEQWNLPVLVCNAGGNSGEATIELARGTADALGDVIDRRRVNLGPGEARILRLSVRMAYLEQSGALEMVVHSPDDSEEFSATASGTVEEVTGPGRPGTLGGEFGGTLGGDNPRTLGRMRAHEGVIDPDIARVPGDWAITLENPAGERRHFNAVREVDPSGEHTKLSTWSAVVPADPTVPDWSDNTKAWITLDEKIQWVGYCENATLSTDGQTTHLEGRGPGADLDDGSFEFRTGGIAEYAAIENAAERYAPEWDWYVVRPDEPTVIPDDTTLTGSRIDIIKQLHDDWGYRFLIDNREFKRAISFPPQGATSTREITVLDWERSEGSERQYNRVEIRGDWRRDEEGVHVGGRYYGEATDEDAIEQRADEYGIPEESATETYHRTDSSIESDEMAHARAEAKLRELREHDEYGGSLNTLAQRVNAGLAYPMPWDDEVQTGAWSGKFDQGDGVSDIGQAFRESHRDGALTMWVKASWSDRSEREMRMIAGIHDVTETNSDGRALGITTTDPEGLGLQIDTTTGDTASARAYPDELPPDDEWIFLHFDWERIAATDSTILRAGRNGTVTNTVTVPGRIRQPHDTGWIGRYNQDHYVGLIDKISIWNAPLTDSEYARLAVGGDIPSENLVARYPFEEGPHDTSGQIHDVIGGVHGEIDTLRWGGTPQTLESYSYDMEAKTMDLAYEQIAGYASHERLENLEAEIERLKRRQN